MNKRAYYQQREARQQNASLLLRDLWFHAPLSRAMLAQRNGLTKGTISLICKDLAALNLIRDAGQDRTGPGRPGDLIELNPAARCAIGVEISTNYAAVVLTDLCGKPLWQGTLSLEIGSPQDVILTQVERLVTEAVARAGGLVIPLLGIGVGAPGIVGDQPIKTAAPGWNQVALKQRWEKRFEVPVSVDNKARAAAMLEAMKGSAKEAESFLYVSVGTDVGSTVEAALVTESFQLRGGHGWALDVAHMVLDPNGPPCTCGQRGCWRALVDVDREAGLLRQRLDAGEASVLREHAAGLDHRMIHQAAVEGDRLAIEVASSVLMNHALGIANLVLLFHPRLVVIGWETMVFPPQYTARMRFMDSMPELNISAAVCQRLERLSVKPPRFVHAALDPEVVMLGAAALLVDEFLRTPPIGEV